jgi:hypothetical protein
MTLVGLDVHARQTHAATLMLETGELGCCRLRMAPEEVAGFLAGLPAPVLAVYEAGPTRFGLARAGTERGIEVRVVAPGVDPEGLRRQGQDRPAGRDPAGQAAGGGGAELRVRADGGGRGVP